MVASVAVVAIVCAVVLTGVAGIAPWSRMLPFGHPQTSGATADLSYSAAEAVAAAAVAGSAGGPWSPVSAAGFALHSPLTLPPVGAGNASFVSPTGCIGSRMTTAGARVTLPAAPAGLGPGLAPGWILDFGGSPGNVSVVLVMNGTASVVATASGGECPSGTAFDQPIPSGAIDSTEAAAIADAWGGTAFRANSSSLSAVYTIQGPLTLTIPTCCVVGGGNGSGGNGSGQLPAPPYYPNGSYPNYTLPATWTVMYGNCAGASGVLPCGTRSAGTFLASIDPMNGTVRSVFAMTGAAGYPLGLNPGGPAQPPVAGATVPARPVARP